MIIVGFALGIFYLSTRLFQIYKNKKKVQDLLKQQKFELKKTSNIYIIITAILFVLSIISLILSIKDNDQTNLTLGIVLLFFFITEAISFYVDTKVYYNDKGLILNEKYVRYKSIKLIKRAIKINISKCKIYTFSNEEYVVSMNTAKFIQEKTDLEII